MIVMIHRLRGRSPAVLVPWTPLYLSASLQAGECPLASPAHFRTLRCARMTQEGHGGLVLVIYPSRPGQCGIKSAEAVRRPRREQGGWPDDRARSTSSGFCVQLPPRPHKTATKLLYAHNAALVDNTYTACTRFGCSSTPGKYMPQRVRTKFLASTCVASFVFRHGSQVGCLMQSSKQEAVPIASIHQIADKGCSRKPLFNL